MVGRPGLEPGTTGLKVHWEFNADSAFQHPPSPILARYANSEACRIVNGGTACQVPFLAGIVWPPVAGIDGWIGR